jgi:hypothetical protein
MTNPTPDRSQASRWDALLGENSILHKEHLALLSSFTLPLSAQQTAQVEANAARRASLPLKIQELVEEWADGREGLQQPRQRQQEQG